VSFKSGVKESIKLVDNKLSLTFVWKDSHHKHESRNTNNDVSNRTRSKANYTVQQIGSRTRLLSTSFFALIDAILFYIYKVSSIRFDEIRSIGMQGSS
jgi:uncharacterized membrane protein